MANNSIVEKICRQLAEMHYSERFQAAAGREEIVRQNVEANWQTFSPQVKASLKIAGEEFAKFADQEERDRRKQVAFWQHQNEGPDRDDLESKNRFIQNNLMEADCAARIAASIRLRTESEIENG